MPDYSQGPGYRHESDTSREAAERCVTAAQKNRRLALDYIRAQGMDGATIDEVCVYLSKALGRQVPPNAISGRFIELEGQEVISKTPQRRKTRSGRRAVVYIAGSWKDFIPGEGSGPVMARAEPQSQVEAYKAKLRATGQEKQYFEHLETREKDKTHEQIIQSRQDHQQGAV